VHRSGGCPRFCAASAAPSGRWPRTRSASPCWCST
jgi:hypothetical protein